MDQGTEEMMKMSAAMAQTGTAAAQTALDGMRRLAEVNLQAARSSLEQSAEQIHALLSAKDINTLAQLVTAMAQPSPEKFTAYALAVAAVAQDTQSDLARLVCEQIERTNQQLAATMESIVRGAPAGSDGAVGFIRQAMQTATASYEQFNQNMQRLMEQGAQQAADTTTGTGAAASKPSGGTAARRR
jgi:phasin family protein